VPGNRFAEAIAQAVEHQRAGRLQEARTTLRQVLACDPRHPEAWHLFGLLAYQRGELGAAVSRIRRAIALKPHEALFHQNLGAVWSALQKPDSARRAWQKALRLGCADAETLLLLGQLLEQRREPEPALAVFRRAARLHPDNAEAQARFGHAFARAGRLPQALAPLRRAVRLQPSLASAHASLGEALERLGHLSEAIESYQRAVECRPDYTPALARLTASYFHRGLLRQSIGCGRRLVDHAADSGAHSSLLGVLNHDPSLSPEELFEEHRAWAARWAKPLPATSWAHRNRRDPERRLRLGYVSAHLCQCIDVWFVESFLPFHDLRGFQVICYADVAQPDAVTRRLEGQMPLWRNIASLDDEQAARQIRRDRIDVLIDLDGHWSHRLPVFARRPAPVQALYMSYPNTSGLDTMDYRLTDERCDPPGWTEALHTEELVRLPRVFCCFKPLKRSPPVGPLPAGSRRPVTFGAFHRPAKVNDRVVRAWAEILHRTPGSRLLMHHSFGNRRARGGAPVDAGLRSRYQEMFQAHGIGPERLKLVGGLPPAEHFALYNRVDLALDTFPFTGTTTTCVALWMGVPVVTLAGRTSVSRVSASQLASLGLEDWIAESVEKYVELAVAKATDRPRLAQLRAELRGRMRRSSLTDGAGMARTLEETYRWMWRRWCASPR